MSVHESKEKQGYFSLVMKHMLYGIRVPRPTWALDHDLTKQPMTPTPLFEARP